GDESGLWLRRLPRFMRDTLRLGTAMIETLCGPAMLAKLRRALIVAMVRAGQRERPVNLGPYRAGARQDARCAMIGMRALTAPAMASSRRVGLAGLRTRGVGRATRRRRATE